MCPWVCPRLLFLCCAHVQVRQLSELSQVNERCLELQRNKSSASSSKRKGARHDPPAAAANTSSVVGFSGAPRPPQQQQRRRGSGSGSGGGRSKSGGCPYLSVEGGVSGWEDFADTVLASPMDVEELAALGGRMKVGCSDVRVVVVGCGWRHMWPLWWVSGRQQNSTVSNTQPVHTQSSRHCHPQRPPTVKHTACTHPTPVHPPHTYPSTSQHC